MKINRRSVLRQLSVTAAALCWGRLLGAEAPLDASAAAASAHFPFGPVVPTRPIPAWPVRTQTGLSSDLQSLLRGHVSALQLMFTGCNSTCPIQGAIFASAQRQLGASLPHAQFLSISIAPEADTPKALSGWLQQYKAQPGWMAVSPHSADLDALTAILRGETGLRTGSAPRAGDSHTAQVYIVDSQAQLVYRSANFPPADRIVGAMRHYASGT